MLPNETLLILTNHNGVVFSGPVTDDFAANHIIKHKGQLYVYSLEDTEEIDFDSSYTDITAADREFARENGHHVFILVSEDEIGEL